MIWSVAVAAGILVAAGVYLALARDLLRCVIGLSLLGAGVNLVVLASGRLGSNAPPFVASGLDRLATDVANPLPQALVLTAIVIGFSLTCFSMILVLALRQQGMAGSADLRSAEPPAGPDRAAPVLDDDD
jgi:multicomponent Na+:H+ antiporter subunit C